MQQQLSQRPHTALQTLLEGREGGREERRGGGRGGRREEGERERGREGGEGGEGGEEGGREGRKEQRPSETTGRGCHRNLCSLELEERVEEEGESWLLLLPMVPANQELGIGMREREDN